MNLAEYEAKLKEFFLNIPDKEKVASIRYLARTDLYFLIRHVLKRKHIEHPWLFDRCREVQKNPNNCIDIWSREHLKLLSHNTPVFTPNGWTAHGEIKPGDNVFSPQGKSVKVLAVTGTQHDPNMCELQFQNLQRAHTEHIKAGYDHLWDVEYFDRARVSGTNKRLGWTKATLSTKDLIDRTLAQKLCTNPRWYRIKRTNPFEYPGKDLPIKPYTLGAWLGDGDNAGGVITNRNNQFWGKIKLEYSIGGEIGKKAWTQRRTVYGLVTKLRANNLLHNKHIPIEYLTASIAQRTSLLQGLMDTDGTVMQRGTVSIASIYPGLASGIVSLLATFGILAKANPHEIECNGEPYPYYVIDFAVNGEVEPFSLDYHKKRLGKIKTKQLYWYLTDIQAVKSVPSQCIQVEGGRYVAGNLNIPTHNSTIITNGKTIQDILASHGENPLPIWNGEEVVVGIFSHTRPIAKAFLREIKVEFEDNEYLKEIFPDILYSKPSAESSKWSEDDGICVKRKSNRKEQTVEAYGLVDGMPTSRHYTIMVYDDVVTDKSVTSPEMIKKTTEAMALSYNLGARGGHKRVIGTFYHFNDTYRQLIKKDTFKLRFYPATDTGKKDGKPVFLTQEQYQQKVDESLSSYVFACQILLDPIADEAQGFKEEDIQHTGYNDGHGMNIYLLVDPANAKKKENDYTVMSVIGVGTDKNEYLLDGIRDRLNLTERTNALMALHRQWSPLKVGYEQYGMQADIQHIKHVQSEENYRFDIVELGGNMPKEDRIRRLLSPVEKHRFYVPNNIRKFNQDRKGYCFVQEFLEEIRTFPVSIHDDVLDCIARVEDPKLGAVVPKTRERTRTPIQATGSYNVHGW